MRAVISLEFIGEDYYDTKKNAPHRKNFLEQYERRLGRDKSRPWVAKLLDIDWQFHFKREFMRPQKDFTHANSTGSRGVYLYYVLKPGIYEVNERLSWRKTKRWFCRVNDKAEIIKLEKEEVINCLKNGILV